MEVREIGESEFTERSGSSGSNHMIFKDQLPDLLDLPVNPRRLSLLSQISL
jgi:hypothetical protein